MFPQMFTDIFCIPNSTTSGFITGELRVLLPVRLPQPLVVVLHGLRGFARWGMFPYTAQMLASAGMPTLTMNFSLNGVSRVLTDDERANKDISCLEEFTELNNFAKNTTSQECDDIRTVLSAMQRQTLFEGATYSHLQTCWNGDVCLLAHSRGGAVAWIVAPEFPAIKRIATWNTVGALDRFTVRQKKLWHEQGYIESPNARTGQMMRQNLSYLEDIERNASIYEPLKAIQRVTMPVLLLHAEQDMTVSHTHSFDLANALQASYQQAAVQVELIPQTGHTFGTVHPFAGTTPALERALERTQSFFIPQSQ
jgi:pimeloyl-ACP methyl ester carboxylesterase